MPLSVITSVVIRTSLSCVPLIRFSQIFFIFSKFSRNNYDEHGAILPVYVTLFFSCLLSGGGSISFKTFVYKHAVESRNIHFTLLVYNRKGKGKVHQRTDHEGPEGEQRYSATLSSNLGARWGWVVNVTPRPLYSR